MDEKRILFNSLWMKDKLFNSLRMKNELFKV